MRVLLTNDDGINSPGLRALAEGFAPHHETVVVAPEQERSATGHAITLHKPLRATRSLSYSGGVVAWATNGTPADCVVLGVLELLEWRPDVVVSGVNVGANLGRRVRSRTERQPSAVTLSAMRIHGGYGYTTEFPVERYYRDAPRLLLALGGIDADRVALAARLSA